MCMFSAFTANHALEGRTLDLLAQSRVDVVEFSLLDYRGSVMLCVVIADTSRRDGCDSDEGLGRGGEGKGAPPVTPRQRRHHPLFLTRTKTRQQYYKYSNIIASHHLPSFSKKWHWYLSLFRGLATDDTCICCH